MAQVIRKFKPGGRVIRDGKIQEITDDYLADLLAQGEAAFDDPLDKANVGRIVSALRSGDVQIDSANNTLSGVNFELNTPRQERRAGRKTTGAGQILDEVFGGGKANSAKNVADWFINRFNHVTPTLAEPVDNRRSADHSAKLTLSYITNDDGSRTLDKSAKNDQIRRRLQSLYGLDTEDYKSHKAYKGFSDWDAQLAYIKNTDTNYEDLIKEIESGNISPNTLSILNSIGIFDGSETEEGSADAAAKKSDAALKSAGIDPEVARDHIFIDDKGRMTFSDAFKKAFAGDIWFNDYWKAQNTNLDWDFLYGKVKIGDYLYDANDINDPNSELSQLLTRSGFLDKMRANNYTDANQTLNFLHGNPMEFLSYDPNSQYNKWLSEKAILNGKTNPNFRYRSETGSYVLPEGQQLVSYYDGTERDAWGMPTLKYMLFDENGNATDIDINQYQRREKDQMEVTPFKGVYQLITDENSPYKGYYKVEHKTDSGENPLSLYYNSKDPNDVIMDWAYLDNFGAFKNQNIRLPREFVEALQNNPDIIRNLLSDKKLQERFMKMLRPGVTTAWRDNWNFDYNRSKVKHFEDLGFNEETAKHLERVFTDWGRRNGKNASKRQSERLVVPMNQKGGLIGKAVESVAPSEKEIKDYKDAAKTAGVHDDWNLSSADKLQIASIAGDVASLVAAIPTGGNPLAAGIGAGSTLAQFGADVKRDGLDWGDAGNLVLGLGLDAVSLLPGVGITAKSAKTVKGLRVAYKTIKTALTGIGAIGAVNGLKNIVNGNGTLDDWKKLSTGLLAIKGVGDTLKRRAAIRNLTDAPEVKSTKVEVPNKTYDDALNSLKEDKKTKAVKDIVDTVVKRNEDLKKFNGNDVAWVSKGEVSNYDEAFKALRESGHIKNKDINAALPPEAKLKTVPEKTTVFGKNLKNNLSDKSKGLIEWLTPTLEGRTLKTGIDYNNLPWYYRRGLRSAAALEPDVVRNWSDTNAFGGAFGIMGVRGNIFSPGPKRLSLPAHGYMLSPGPKMQFIQIPYRTLDTSMKFPEGTQFRLFKKGGVIKAQDGAKTIPEDLKKPIITPELRSKVESQIMPSTKLEIVPMSIEQLRPAAGTVVQGQTTSDTSKLDLKNIGDQILRGLEAATVGNAIRKDADIKRKALKDVGEILNKTEAPSSETLRWAYNTRQIEDAKKEILSMRDTPSSDPMKHLAFKLAQAKQIAELGKKALDSEIEYTNTLQYQNQQIRNANNAERIALENKKKQNLAQNVYGLGQIDASENAQRANLYKTMIDEEREGMHRDELERIAGETGILQAQEVNQYQQILDNFDRQITADYDKHKSNEAFQKQYGSLEAYKNAMYVKYEKELEELSRIYSVRSSPNMLAYLQGSNRSIASKNRVYNSLPNYKPISFIGWTNTSTIQPSNVNAKNGGSLPKRSTNTAEWQMKIDSHKVFLAKMKQDDEHLFKLLMKLLS